MKCLSLVQPFRGPGAKPFEPFGKGSNAQKAETPDAGPTGPAASNENGRPFSSQPGPTDRAGYMRIGSEKASTTGLLTRPRFQAARGPDSRIELQAIGELDRQVDAVAYLAGAGGAVVVARRIWFSECDQAVEAFGQ